MTKIISNDEMKDILNFKLKLELDSDNLTLKSHEELRFSIHFFKKPHKTSIDSPVLPDFIYMYEEDGHISRDFIWFLNNYFLELFLRNSSDYYICLVVESRQPSGMLCKNEVDGAEYTWKKTYLIKLNKHTNQNFIIIKNDYKIFTGKYYSMIDEWINSIDCNEFTVNYDVYS